MFLWCNLLYCSPNYSPFDSVTWHTHCFPWHFCLHFQLHLLNTCLWVNWLFWKRSKDLEIFLSLYYKLTIVFRFLSYMLIMFLLRTPKVIGRGRGRSCSFSPHDFIHLHVSVRFPNLNLKLQFVKYCSDPPLYLPYDMFTSFHTPNTRECTRPWKCTSVSLVTWMRKD
jgi:hypothetical protein